MPALRLQPAPVAAHEPNYPRIRDLAQTLSHEPEQILPAIAFLKRTYPQRDALLDLSLEACQQARRLLELAGEGSSQRAALTALADQLLAGLDQMRGSVNDLRDEAQAQEAVVTIGKAIQMQGKIAVMECLLNLLLLELE